MKEIIELLNGFALLGLKLNADGVTEKYQRQLDRIQNATKAMGYDVLVPLGENYSETRTDIEATISGDTKENMTIIQVIKPVIYFNGNLLQRGIVLVG